MEQGQKEQVCSCTGSGWPLSEISYKTEGGLLLAHTNNKMGSAFNFINYFCLDLDQLSKDRRKKRTIE